MAVTPKVASEIILSSLKKAVYELLPIEQANQRVLAQDIIASSSLPKFDNSAMDGYAILIQDKNKILEVIDTIFAGDNNKKILEEGSCIKIMTGARIPANCTAVVPKEDVEITSDNKVKLNSKIKEYQHIRFIGEDIKTGEILIKKGEILNFSHITLLSSQGISYVKLIKKPKIVVFSSGEELKLHYEKIEPYQIYNSNTPTLLSRSKELGCEVSFIGQAQDSIESIKDSVLNALDADLIITSGGVSVGDADYTKAAFNELSFTTLFDGILIKPGKPTVFGKIDNSYILNLPGNPLAAALIFELFGKLIINKLLGVNDIYHNYIETSLEGEFINSKAQMGIIPGFFDGSSFSICEKRRPGMVSTLSHCNAIIVIDKSVKKLSNKSKVKVLPISWKFFTNKEKDYLTYE